MVPGVLLVRNAQISNEQWHISELRLRCRRTCLFDARAACMNHLLCSGSGVSEQEHAHTLISKCIPHVCRYNGHLRACERRAHRSGQLAANQSHKRSSTCENASTQGVETNNANLRRYEPWVRISYGWGALPGGRKNLLPRHIERRVVANYKPAG